MEWLREQIYNNFITDNRWRYLTNGLKVTLEVTFFAVLIGILLGLLVAVVRSTYAKTGKMKIANFLCGIYITVIRGTPVVVQLLIIYFVVFGSVKIDKVFVALMWQRSSVPASCPSITGSLKLEEALASVMEKPCFILSCRRHLKMYFRHLETSLSFS